MNIFIQRAIKEHIRQKDIKMMFSIHNHILADVMRNPVFSLPEIRQYLKGYEDRCLIMLAPLVEIAWADGSLRTREMNAIFKVAETYGLDKYEEAYAELIDSMISKATPYQVEMLWNRFHELLECLTEDDYEAVKNSLMMQAHYVAEHCSNDSINYLRGDCISPNEEEILLKIRDEISKAKELKRKENPESVISEAYLPNTHGETAVESRNNSYRNSEIEDISDLLPLVPLVKVAWAEGRITKREREMLFETAKGMGIRPGSPSHQRLSDWLEMQPINEFYTESLEKLYKEWLELPEEERILSRLDIIADCINIAEASGGTSKYPAGGPRICEEESAAVKSIARKFSLRSAVAA